MSECIVAIDLGTSRSAWAFSFQGQAEEAVSIRVPEGCMPPASGTKTETAVLLNAEDYRVLAFGRAARERFIQESQDTEDAIGDRGAEVGSRPLHAQPSAHDNGLSGGLEAHRASPGTSMLFRWFKMELCRKAGFRNVADPAATAEGGQTVPLLKVMAAVLRHFKEDALAYLSTLSQMNYTVQDVMWVVTIPAIYDDFARRFMRVAAHEAGLINTVDSPRLRLCLEPEAACLAVSVKEAPGLSQPGTQTMILDCGGGTVDITTHEITSLNPLRLKELLPPTGGPWGSTYVDSQFTEWFRTFVGDDEYTRIRRTSTFYTLLTQWEEQKTRFRGDDETEVVLNMVEFAGPLGYTNAKIQELRAAHNERNIEAPSLHVAGRMFIVKLPSALVRSFFAPVIEKISACLDGLRRNPSLVGLKYVFMVGGFSACSLLQAAAKASLDGDGCRVIVTLRPDVAIVKGAVLCANNADVFTTRKARLTYGMRALCLYNSSNPEHAKRRPVIPIMGDDEMENIVYFSRHVNVGDDIPLHHACPKQSYTPIRKSQTAISITILASHKENIEFPDKGSTFPLGQVTVPVDMTADYADRGVVVQFVFGGTELSVHCFAATTGAEIGNVDVELVQEAIMGG